MTEQEIVEVLNYRMYQHTFIGGKISDKVAWYKQSSAILQFQCTFINLLVAIFYAKIHYAKIRKEFVPPAIPSLSMIRSGIKNSTGITYNEFNELSLDELLFNNLI